MSLRWHRRIAVLLGILAGSTMSAGAATWDGATPTAGKPVIGRPATVSAQPQAGKPFSVSFKVTQQGTGTPLTRGRMICDPRWPESRSRTRSRSGRASPDSRSSSRRALLTSC